MTKRTVVKVRRTWLIKPAGKVVPSRKLYSRKRQKRQAQRELTEQR